MPRAFRCLVPLLIIAAFTQCRDQAPNETPATIAVTPSSGTMVSGATMVLVAKVSNSIGDPLLGQTMDWSSTDPDVASVTSSGIVTAVHTGEARLVASIGSVHSVPVAITVTAGAASQLVVRTQPAGASSGAALTTQPIVEVRDLAGNVVTTATPTITATIATGGGTLVGSTATAVGGVATFSSLAVSGAIGDRTLMFSVDGLTPAMSSGFALGAGAAAKLVILTEPTGAASGAVLRTQPVIEIRDDANNRVTTSTTTVSATISAGGGSATRAVAPAVGGIATFAALTIVGTAGAHTLTFNAPGLPTVISANFVLSPGAPALLRLRAPLTGAITGQRFVQPPVIEVTDGGGNFVAVSGIVVTATVSSGGGAITAAAATTTDGVATFSGLTVSGPTGFHTLTFFADGLTPITSAPFVLSAGTPVKLVILVQPSGAASGTLLTRQPVIAVADADGNLVFDYTGSVNAVVATGSGSTINTNAAIVNGTANFQSLALSGPIGSVTIVFRSGALQPVTSAPVAITAGPSVQMIVRVAPPLSVRDGVPMVPQPIVTLLDAGGNLSNSSVVVSFITDAVSGTITHATAVAINGVATFSGLTLSGPPGDRNYVFTAPGVSISGTYRITINP